MNCEEFILQLDQLMDGALDDEGRRALEAHARDCPDCAEQLRLTLSMRDMLNDLPDEADVPLAAQAGWRGAIRREAGLNRRRRFTRLAAMAAAAAVLALGIGLAVPPARLNQSAVVNAKSVSDSVAPEAAAPESAAFEDAAMESEAEYAYESSAMEVTAGGALEMAEAAAPMMDAAPLETDGAEDSGNAGASASVSVRVADVASAGQGILDTALELDADARLFELDGAARVEATLPVEAALELLEAARQWDAEPDDVVLPELPEAGAVTLLIALQPA